MLRFSIREVMLLMLCVGSFVGWWKEHATADAERKRLADKSQKLRESARWNEAKVDILLRANSALEAENGRLKRRMLDDSTQLDLLLERFRQSPFGS